MGQTLSNSRVMHLFSLLTISSSFSCVMTFGICRFWFSSPVLNRFQSAESYSLRGLTSMMSVVILYLMVL